MGQAFRSEKNIASTAPRTPPGRHGRLFPLRTIPGAAAKRGAVAVLGSGGQGGGLKK